MVVMTSGPSFCEWRVTNTSDGVRIAVEILVEMSLDKLVRLTTLPCGA